MGGLRSTPTGPSAPVRAFLDDTPMLGGRLSAGGLTPRNPSLEVPIIGINPNAPRPASVGRGRLEGIISAAGAPVRGMVDILSLLNRNLNPFVYVLEGLRGRNEDGRGPRR